MNVPRDRLWLVINRWGQKGQLPLKEIESALAMKAAALIPDDPAKVNRAVNEGKLLRQFGGLSRISRRFTRLASQLSAPVCAASR
jgi:Flp pilus assembly CpaE family ATPase